MIKGNLTIPTSQVPNIEINPNSLGFIMSNRFPSLQSTFKYLYSRSQVFTSLYMRQDTIARDTGFERETSNRALKFLHLHGFILKHRRPGKKTCEYFIGAFWMTSAGRLILIIIFHISFLCVGFEPYVTQLNITNVNKEILAQPESAANDVFVNLFSKKEQNSTAHALSNKPATQLLYSSAQPPWLYRTEEIGEPNKKRTFEQFEALFFNEREQYMNNFSQEQLVQLSPYSKEVLSYATKMLTKDMAGGKPITNQFAYFKSICERQKNKTPQAGYAKPTTRPTSGPQSAYKHVEFISETDFDFVYNSEKVLHNCMLHDETFHKGAARVENPKWKLITVEQQQQVMREIHVDCTCRQLVDRSIHDEPVVDKKETTEPVTKLHTFDWNSLVPEPKVVTECHTLEDPPAQYIGEEYGEFEEVLD